MLSFTMAILCALCALCALCVEITVVRLPCA